MSLFDLLYAKIPPLSDVLSKSSGGGFSLPSLSGGEILYDLTGNVIAQATPNISGGTDIIDGQLSPVASTMPGVGRDSVYAPDNEHIANVQDNIMGGDNFSAPSGDLLGHSEPNLFGGHDILGADGSELASSSANIFGGVNFDGIGGHSIDATGSSLPTDAFDGLDIPEVGGGFDVLEMSEFDLSMLDAPEIGSADFDLDLDFDLDIPDF